MHLWHLALIFLGSFAVSLVLQKFFKFPPANRENRIITTLILFLLFNPFVASPIFLLIGAAAELTQRLLRTTIGPIFNPAASVAFVFGLAGIHAAWWGSNFAPYLYTASFTVSLTFFLIVPVAGYVAYRYRKFPLLASFLIVFSLMNLLFWERIPVSLFTSSYGTFFLLIMAIEPKTSPNSPRKQIVYGGILGVALPIFTWLGFIDAALMALLLGNLYTAFSVLPRINK